MLGIAEADVQLVFTSVSIPIVKMLQYSHACWLIVTFPVIGVLSPMTPALYQDPPCLIKDGNAHRITPEQSSTLCLDSDWSR